MSLRLAHPENICPPIVVKLLERITLVRPVQS